MPIFPEQNRKSLVESEPTGTTARQARVGFDECFMTDRIHWFAKLANHFSGCLVVMIWLDQCMGLVYFPRFLLEINLSCIGRCSSCFSFCVLLRRKRPWWPSGGSSSHDKPATCNVGVRNRKRRGWCWVEGIGRFWRTWCLEYVKWLLIWFENYRTCWNLDFRYCMSIYLYVGLKMNKSTDSERPSDIRH